MTRRVVQEIKKHREQAAKLRKAALRQRSKELHAAADNFEGRAQAGLELLRRAGLELHFSGPGNRDITWSPKR